MKFPHRTLLAPLALLSTSHVLLQESAPPAPSTGSLREMIVPDPGAFTVREEKRGGKTVTLLDITVATIGKVNRNGRLYPRATWEAAVTAVQDDLKAGKLWGLLEHPDGWFDPAKGTLDRICLKYETLEIDGDIVKGTAVLVETSYGVDLKALVSAGVSVGVSSNGHGSIKYQAAKELNLDLPNPDAYIAVVQDDFRLLTIDAVSDPSDLAGRLTQKERAARDPRQENRMHPLLKQLCERLGKTLEQVKVEHAPEYYKTLEQIAEQVASATAAPVPVTPPVAPAAQPNAPPAPAAPAVAGTQAEQTLESQVLSLTTELRQERAERIRTARRNIAIQALEAANLPKAPKVGDVDLDARFRERLEAASVSASSDQEAEQLVDAMIVERRALLGVAATPAPAARQFEHLNRATPNGVRLPQGDNNAPAPTFDGPAPLAAIAAELGLS